MNSSCAHQLSQEALTTQLEQITIDQSCEWEAPGGTRLACEGRGKDMLSRA
jgi:hypothetical protein